MIVTEKTSEFDKWIRKLKSSSEFRNSKLMNILETASLLEAELVKYGLTMPRATECISRKRKTKL